MDFYTQLVTMIKKKKKRPNEQRGRALHKDVPRETPSQCLINIMM